MSEQSGQERAAEDRLPVADDAGEPAAPTEAVVPEDAAAGEDARSASPGDTTVVPDERASADRISEAVERSRTIPIEGLPAAAPGAGIDPALRPATVSHAAAASHGDAAELKWQEPRPSFPEAPGDESGVVDAAVAAGPAETNTAATNTAGTSTAGTNTAGAGSAEPGSAEPGSAEPGTADATPAAATTEGVETAPPSAPASPSTSASEPAPSAHETIVVDRSSAAAPPERDALDALVGDAAPVEVDFGPTRASNRGFAAFLAVVIAVVYAVGLTAAVSGLQVFYGAGDFAGTALAFAGTVPLYGSAVVVALFTVIWSVIANRAGWWSYIVAGLIGAIVAFDAYYLGVAAQLAINGEVFDATLLRGVVTDPAQLAGALIAAIVARESITWIGGLIAIRGRRQRRRDAERAPAPSVEEAAPTR